MLDAQPKAGSPSDDAPARARGSAYAPTLLVLVLLIAAMPQAAALACDGGPTRASLGAGETSRVQARARAPVAASETAPRRVRPRACASMGGPSLRRVMGVAPRRGAVVAPLASRPELCNLPPPAAR